MTRDEVKAAFREKARRTTPIEIEGVGTVYVRKLKLKDTRALAKRDGEDDEHYGARLAAFVILDASGVPIYDANNEADILEMMELDLEDVGLISKANESPTSGN